MTCPTTLWGAVCVLLFAFLAGFGWSAGAWLWGRITR